MKKLFSVAVCAAVIGWAGSASAALWEDTVNFGFFGKTLLEGSLFDQFSYSHATPTDFEVPFDTVNSATVVIKGAYAAGTNDNVYFEGVYSGYLTSGGTFLKRVSSTFDVGNIFTSWTNGNTLDVTIDANGNWKEDGVLSVYSSKFTLDYNNGTAPVPEPTTMLLFGTGLLGLAAVGRRRKATKA